MGSWKMNAGINHAPAYEVSGKPFASGGINATTPTKIEFPYVTRWIYVINHGAESCKVGFSERGMENENYYFRLGREQNSQPNTSQRLEIKVSEIWLSGSPDVDIVAGLTTIRSDATSMGGGLPSWSGSTGVG